MSKWQQYFYEEVVYEVEEDEVFQSEDLDIDRPNTQIGNILSRAARTFASNYVERVGSPPRGGAKFRINDISQALTEAEDFEPDSQKSPAGTENLIEHALDYIQGEGKVQRDEVINNIFGYLQSNSQLRDYSKRLEKAAEIADRLKNHPDILYDDIEQAYKETT